MLKVLKFGGSSMADAQQYEKIKSIVEADLSRRVVVVSAAGKRFSDDHKLTDLLYLCYAHLQYGVSCDSVWEMITERYLEIRDALQLQTDLESEFAQLREKMDKKAVTQDELVSRGEYFSARLMADYLGFEFLDSVSWLKFKFDGTVDQEKSYALLRELVGRKKVVIPGFYGAMPDGHIKTFTRGGSDITGALAAAALDADVYENWTDVSGMLMADPRIVENPQPIPHVTYSELRELSYIGAQVLHEGTIFPVREKGIPLNIRNTNDPSHPGTMIQAKFDDAADETHFITGIAGKKNFSIITIAKNGMSSELGIWRRILEVFEAYNVNIAYAPSGIDCLSLVFPASQVNDNLYALMGELQKKFNPDSITLTENISIVAAVGRKMAYRLGVSGQIFATLGQNGINVRMITQGPQELNIIFGVDNKDFDNAIRVLYNSFVKSN